LIDILQQIYTKPLAVQSNLARAQAPQVAALASLGLITTQIRPNEFGALWRITNKGLLLLNSSHANNEEHFYG
jgi:hypothetical protein